MNNKYEIGYPAYIIKKDMVVKIEDSEVIDKTLIFYTSDGSCYPFQELTFLNLPDYENEIQNLVKKTLMECFTKESLLPKQIEIKKRLSNYEKTKTTLPNNNNRSTSWLRKVVSYLSKLGRGVRN